MTRNWQGARGEWSEGLELPQEINIGLPRAWEPYMIYT